MDSGAWVSAQAPGTYVYDLEQGGGQVLEDTQDLMMELMGRVVDGVILDDPYVYADGCTTSHLRSGVDGPHAGLADRLCNINGRLYS